MAESLAEHALWHWKIFSLAHVVQKEFREGKQMEVFDTSRAIRMVTLLSGAIKGMGFYPPSHPSIHQPMTELHTMLSQVFLAASDCSCGVIDGLLFFEDHLFVTPTAAVADLSNRLIEKQIGRIVFANGCSLEDLKATVKLLSSRTTTVDQIRAKLMQQKISTILLVKQGEENYSLPTDDESDQLETAGCNMETYNHALNAIRGVCRDIERGRIPNSSSVIKVVDRMVGITMHEPSALLGLTMIKDYDNYTFNHCINVGVLAMALGAALGMDSISVRSLGIAGQLHDIGKTMIPKSIINKPGKLSSNEFEEIKRHPELGAKIIREMKGLEPHIGQIVLGHHLNYDRNGYPAWAQKLPFNQMIDIVAIADTYDAITTLRVYQHPISPYSAIKEMQRIAGSALDAELVGRFIDLMGIYPVGTLVRLDNNEVAVVYRPNPLDHDTPMVRVLIEADGTRLAVPREQRLLGQDGARYASIISVVDPLLKNLDVGKFVLTGNY